MKSVYSFSCFCTGSKEDVQKLKSTFQDENKFQVVAHPNQTIDQFMMLLDDIRNLSTSEFCCVVIFLLTHGDKVGVSVASLDPFQ